MRICDAHLHYGCPKNLMTVVENSALRQQFPSYRTVQFSRMDDYEARLAEHQVEKAVLIPFIFRELDTQRENKLIMDYARRYPGKYYPYALLDDEDPAFAERNFRDIVGLKQHIVLHKTELTAVRKEIFSCLQEHDLILLLHTHSDRRIDYVTEIAENFPRLKIQVAHMGRGKPGDIPFMLHVMEALRPFANVFFDTSTIRQPEVVTKAVDLIGAERILYGSDFPFFMDADGTEDIMEQQLQHILRAGLGARAQEQIFADNFDRLITFGKLQ